MNPGGNDQQGCARCARLLDLVLAAQAAIAEMRRPPELAPSSTPPAPADPDDGPDLTPEEMAADMRLESVAMVYRLRMRRHNPLPAVKRGKYVRCSRRAYRAWKRKEDERRS